MTTTGQFFMSLDTHVLLPHRSMPTNSWAKG